MRKNMLDSIKVVNPEDCEKLVAASANYFVLQDYINKYNASIQGV